MGVVELTDLSNKPVDVPGYPNLPLSNNEQKAVQVDHIDMHFGDGSKTVHALSDVSLSVGAGRFVSLVGRSGCGKSTLLRIISGLIKPQVGSVTIMGHHSQAYQQQKRLGFVFQDANLLAWKTVRQNIRLPLDIQRHLSREEREKRTQAMLQLVRLDGFGDHYPSQLSGGMRQRVAIARALAYEPEIMLMDEPFGALDEFTRREMHDELIRIWESRALTVIFVTHSLSEAMYLSDEIVVMAPRPGRIRHVVEVARPRSRDPKSRTDPIYIQQLSELEALLDEQ